MLINYIPTVALLTKSIMVKMLAAVHAGSNSQ